jgi:hypothetical protein
VREPRLKPRSADERNLCSAVAAFAREMEQKLLRKARAGKEGWDTVAPESLARLFAEHLPKGDPVDLANFLMMLHRQGRGIRVERSVTAPRPIHSQYLPGQIIGYEP